jgi:hypothetical protein
VAVSSLVGSDEAESELSFIQRVDKFAVVDPSYKRWIDDKTRIGLFCLRIVKKNARVSFVSPLGADGDGSLCRMTAALLAGWMASEEGQSFSL